MVPFAENVEAFHRVDGSMQSWRAKLLVVQARVGPAARIREGIPGLDSGRPRLRIGEDKARSVVETGASHGPPLGFPPLTRSVSAVFHARKPDYRIMQE